MAFNEQPVKIKGSTVLFGPYECPCSTAHLSSQFLKLKISREDNWLELSLSFKHIHRVEFLDNQDNKGAGLIIHINTFMAQKIQQTLDCHKRDFIDFSTPYATNNFIVMDVVSADPYTLSKMKEMFNFCEQFHRQYVTEQCVRNKKSIPEALALVYTSVISFNQWKTLLGFFRKDVIFEYIETTTPGTHKPLKYTVGKITSYPQDIYSIQRDGRVVQRRRLSDDGNSVGVKYRAPYDTVPNSSQGSLNRNSPRGPVASGTPRTVQPIRLLINRPSAAQQQQQNYANQQPAYYSPHHQPYGAEINGDTVLNVPNMSLAQQRMPASNALGQYDNNVGDIPLPPPTDRKVASNTQKREVHVIEDEEESADDASTSKKRNDTIFVYPPSGPHGCSVHYADLKFLDHSYMLNDTIIDFYLKYVYHELIPEERRKKIFMFNSFFYSRLSQSPTNSKPYASALNRWKRVQSNFQFVKSWTKKVNLFEMNYIIVPINEDIHWYLAIIVNPKLGIVPDAAEVPSTSTSHQDSVTSGNCTNGVDTERSKGPYVIVLDSLIDSDRKHAVVRDILAEYLCLEHADKRKVMNLPGKCFSKSTTRLVTPSGTPQQKNYVDCGLFLLNFAEIFMRNPPKISSTHVSFRSWYPNFQIKGKRDDIKAIIRSMAPHVKFADFLPPNATPTLRKNGKNRKKAAPATPMDILMPPLRTRRHSETSVWEYAKEKQFTSLDIGSFSRSLDSIVQQLREMPPVVITFRDAKRKKAAEVSSAVTTNVVSSAMPVTLPITTTANSAPPLGTLTTSRVVAPAK